MGTSTVERRMDVLSLQSVAHSEDWRTPDRLESKSKKGIDTTQGPSCRRACDGVYEPCPESSFLYRFQSRAQSSLKSESEMKKSPAWSLPQSFILSSLLINFSLPWTPHQSGSFVTSEANMCHEVRCIRVTLLKSVCTQPRCWKLSFPS